MRKWLLILLLLPIGVSAQWLNVGNSLQRTADTYTYRFSLGAPGVWYVYGKSQIDSLFPVRAILNQNATPQTANFNITGSAKIGDTLIMNSGFSGYVTTITNNHNSANAFQISQNTNNLFKASLNATAYMEFGNASTRQDTTFGAIYHQGYAISHSGYGRALGEFSTMYPAANGDTLYASDLTNTTYTGGFNIASIGSITGGSGGTNGTYTAVPLIALTGNGVNATATIVVSGGTATSVTIVNKGSDYAAGNSLTATIPGLTGFSFPVATTGSYTSVVNVDLNARNAILRGVISLPNVASGTVVNYLGLDASNHVVYGTPGGGGGGSVTSVATGYGLLGGTITSSGTLLADSTKVVSFQRLATNLTGYLKTATATTTYSPIAGSSSIVTVGTLSAGSVPYSLLSGSVPTWNQNTTGTAANLSGTPALPNGTTATTQTTGDGSTKIATDAFVLANVGSGLVTSVSNSDGTATISPTTGAVVASVNTAHGFTWSGNNVWSAGMKATGLTTGTPVNYVGQDASGNFLQIAPIIYTSQFNGLGTSLSPLGIVTDNNPASGSGNVVTSNGTYLAMGRLQERTAVSDISYSALITDYLIAYTALSAPRTVTLIALTNLQSQIIKDEAGTAGSNNLTIQAPAGKTIDGATTKVINTNYGSVRLYYVLASGNYFTY